MKTVQGELFVDVAWVAGSAWYIAMSLHYPPAGRLIPLVVGVTSLIVGGVQLTGNFVPAMRRFTHDRKNAAGFQRPALGASRRKQQVAQQVAIPAQQAVLQQPHLTADQAGAARLESEADTSETVRQWRAILWAAGLIAGIFVLGFVAAIPLFFLAYFLVQKSQRNWKLAVVSAVVMGLLTYGVFDQILGLQLYNGLLFS
ncbi:tripartite tricarboxylate transporter TctB family protein [Alicyclobacillus tolerans]|uniref:tripartite tricarboxylate transporter TctB family protein n=1 Tax=Alicyclobacillus tolerans TaxID=90970 RepID=UPI001F1E7E1E|nr:tripartite tricarboxylate transporter TctB family protein [Alicyclobacillus tolerans]MCF8563145.1 tripartite tricarboxylate transporter TctB family protein [Alicyclobacillus tolerans]